MIAIGELLDPKNDYVFKRIFGHVGNEEITANLISCILKKKITNVELDNNPILEKNVKDDKIGILDIRAKIDNSINCNIEMQIADRKNIEKRILFYWSKIYTASIKERQDFNELEKSIIVLIADYEIENLKEIEKYTSKWNIREEEYSRKILTDVMEFYIIELPKFNRYKEKQEELNNWIRFIKNPEVIDMKESNEAIKQAKKVLEEISQDEHERYLAELREKYIMDQKAIEAAGFDKGIKEGIKEGMKNKSVLIAKKMKEKNIDISLISEVTELTKDEINRL